MDAIILKYWPLFIAAISFVVWLVRLESKASENAKKITVLFELHNKMVERELGRKD